MRILFFNYEYPPLGGGAGNATAYILREFSKIPKLKVDLITSSIDEKYHLEKIGNNIKIHRLPIGKNKEKMHFQSQKEMLFYTWRAYFFAQKLLRKKKYDLTHSFFSVPCGAISWLLWRTKKIPYIISLRGSDVPGYSERFKFIYKIITPIIVQIWKNAEAVVANSAQFKELAKKSNPKQAIKIITNGIDTEEFFAKKIGDKREGEFKVICGSRLTPRKGISYIIEAIDLLKRKNLKVMLEIIGEGNAEKDLKELVRSKGLTKEVIFLGRIEHRLLPKYYQNADVYVSASFNEGMSNTMLEALACGLPIIATETGGTEEMVKVGRNGFVIKMKSAEEIANKIKILQEDFELWKKMSENSRHLAEKMSWENIAKQYFKLYKEVANKNKSDAK